MSVEHINPDTLFKLEGFGQISVPPKGKRLVFLAGQTSLDSSFAVQGETLAEQVGFAVANVVRACEAVGATPADICHATFYITGLTDARFQEFAGALAASLDGGPFTPCASAVVGVERLALGALQFELSATVAVD